ncbi:hypothetical protein PIB30_059581 [Stylosanthes scabra]|uniref:Uncharacterized protein n=1 Tax=Stylosanthes scabra TaxID=79078 RepID=A0ABU6TK25_9FABA|nr:hypothetical protein [Stylosanthes scabra]
MGSLPLRGWSERSFENSREGHGETSRFSLTIGVKWKCSDNHKAESQEQSEPVAEGQPEPVAEVQLEAGGQLGPLEEQVEGAVSGEVGGCPT